MSVTTRRQPISILSMTCLLGIVTALAISWTHGGTVNNGDFSRVFDSMSVHAPGWVPLETEYRILTEPVITPPGSSMGAIGWCFLAISDILGATTIRVWIVGGLMTALYLAGSVLVSLTNGSRRVVVLLLSLMTIIMYGLYFRSVYEEAIVVALTPLLAAGIMRLHQKGTLTLLLVAGITILLAKAQMVFMLPIIIICVWSGLVQFKPSFWKVKGALATALLVATCTGYAGYLSHTAEMSSVNSYNRLYNGIGWALQKSAEWPEKTFADRLAYFQSNRERLQNATVEFEPRNEFKLLGTSYWPDGSELSGSSWQPEATSELRSLVVEVFDEGSFGNYFKYLNDHPSAVASLILNTYRMTATSDYSLSYLRNPSTANSWSSVAFSNFARFSFLVSFLALGGLTMLSRDRLSMLVLLYFTLGAPILVVLGDGYYEFEKHMVPYLMTVPAVAALLICRWGYLKTTD